MALQLRGNAADIKSFVDILGKCVGKSINVDGDGILTYTNGTIDSAKQPLLAEMDRIIKEKKKLEIKVRRKAEKDDPVVDGFCRRLVIVSHIEAFPESPPADHPSAVTRCETIIHILAEYGAAFRDGYTACTDGFQPYHQKGVDAQTALRKTLGQCAAKQNVELKGKLEMQHCNGTKTTVTQDPDTGAITVDNGPKETKKDENPKIVIPGPPQRQDTLRSLFETSPYIFSGVIDDVGEPPRHWSNFFLSYQRVRYSAIEFIRGNLPGAYLDVFHLAMENTVSASAESPGLCRLTFAPGKRLLVFAEPSIDPECTASFRMVANYPNHVLSVGAPQCKNNESVTEPDKG
jgi:hypothetical protein